MLPRSVPLPSLGGQHCGRHWRRSGHWGAAPILLWFVVVPPPGVACSPCLRAGAGSPACRDPRGGRKWGAQGRAACGSSCVPPRTSRSLLGQGGRPLGRGRGRGLATSWPAGQG